MIGRVSSEMTKLNKNGVRFNVAHHTSQKDESGKYITQFVECVCFGETTNRILEYLNKGDMIYVEGKLIINTYNDNQGVSRKNVSVYVEMFRVLQAKEKPQGQYHQVDASAYKKQVYVKKPQSQQIENNPFGDDNSQMPF